MHYLIGFGSLEECTKQSGRRWERVERLFFGCQVVTLIVSIYWSTKVTFSFDISFMLTIAA
jgi:hypothetical protein